MITEPDRCPRCGAQLALVGRLHKDARLGGVVDRRGLGLGKALERPKPRLVKPVNTPVNTPVNRPVNSPVNKAEKRRAYIREKMRARRAAARPSRESPETRPAQDPGGRSLAPRDRWSGPRVTAR